MHTTYRKQVYRVCVTMLPENETSTLVILLFYTLFYNNSKFSWRLERELPRVIWAETPYLAFLWICTPYKFHSLNLWQMCMGSPLRTQFLARTISLSSIGRHAKGSCKTLSAPIATRERTRTRGLKPEVTGYWTHSVDLVAEIHLQKEDSAMRLLFDCTWGDWHPREVPVTSRFSFKKSGTLGVETAQPRLNRRLVVSLRPAELVVGLRLRPIKKISDVEIYASIIWLLPGMMCVPAAWCLYVEKFHCC